MAFEKFTLRGRGFKPQASIWSRGQISFNQGAVRRYNIDKHKYAMLFFDPDTSRIGIRLTNSENEDGIQKIGVRKSGVMLSAKSFLEYYGVDFSETRKYTLQKTEDEGFLLIDLKEQEK